MTRNLFILMALFAAIPTSRAETPAEWLKVMLNPKASWSQRVAAEDSLLISAPETVLPLLLPEISRGMPGGGIWNSGGRDLDRQAPVEWQIFYAISRSWSAQVNRLTHDGGEECRILLTLLEKTASPFARHRLLDDLAIRWVPDAESLISSYLRDPLVESSVRRKAGLVLILRAAENYHDLLLGYAEKSDHVERKLWFDLLSDPRHKRRRGVDPRVIRMGFELIEAEVRASPGYVHGAYFLALKTGDYAGQQFKPDQRDPAYQSKSGLKEAFFEHTVKNSLKWWEENRASVK